MTKAPMHTGYIFLLTDLSHPEYVKVGVTHKLDTVLKQYNGKRPYDCVELKYATKQIDHAKDYKAEILRSIKDKYPSVENRSDWFDIKHLPVCLEIIQKMENDF